MSKSGAICFFCGFPARARPLVVAGVALFVCRTCAMILRASTEGRPSVCLYEAAGDIWVGLAEYPRLIEKWRGVSDRSSDGTFYAACGCWDCLLQSRGVFSHG